MIKEWRYSNLGERRKEVKNLIVDSNYKSIDLGAYADFWSYPEVKFTADVYQSNKEGVEHFITNFEDKSTWDSLLQYVDINGKFDFSICSHTLEDIFNPFELVELLEKVSNRGFIAIPSKYDEFSILYENRYRGNAHHKQFFDIVENELVVYPKYSWIEVDERSNKVIENYKGKELSFYWESKVPIKVFNSGKPFASDQQLINYYYNQLIS